MEAWDRGQLCNALFRSFEHKAEVSYCMPTSDGGNRFSKTFCVQTDQERVDYFNRINDLPKLGFKSACAVQEENFCRFWKQDGVR